jgi:hypothetical protein
MLDEQTCQYVYWGRGWRDIGKKARITPSSYSDNLLALHDTLCSQNKGLALHKKHKNKLQTNVNIRWKLTNSDGRADGKQFRIRHPQKSDSQNVIIHLFYSTGKSQSSGHRSLWQIRHWWCFAKQSSVTRVDAVATQCWRLTPSTCKALRGHTSTFNYGLSRARRNAGCAFSICYSMRRKPKTYVHTSLFQCTCTFGCRQRCSL